VRDFSDVDWALTMMTQHRADYLGKKPVVLFFYLWAFNPV